MRTLTPDDHVLFQDALRGLRAGDFSRLAPLFESPPDGNRCRLIEWYDAGLFDNELSAVDEALTCACFLGRMDVVKYLVARGVDPSAGASTGLDGFHWAANRGQFDVVTLLIERTP